MTTEKKENNPHKDFPGYPHYPAKEDIMNVKAVERVDTDVDNLARSTNQRNGPVPDKTGYEQIDENEDFNRVSKLDSTDIDEDGLDVPGAEDDDANEDIGEEDEENNYYSLGGDNHENLEENG